MTASFKGKLIAGFILAFVAGGVTGAFITFHQGSHWRAEFAHHHPRSFSERMRQRIQADLDLTPEQARKVQPILDRTDRELQQIRRDTGTRVREVIMQTNQALQPFLTDAQRARLRKLEEHSQDEHRTHRHLHHRNSEPASDRGSTPGE